MDARKDVKYQDVVTLIRQGRKIQIWEEEDEDINIHEEENKYGREKKG